MQDNELIEKIESLLRDQIAEVMEFVNCLAHPDDQLLVEAASRFSEPTLRPFGTTRTKPNTIKW